MNRRKVEGIIWFVAGFILILLLANKSKMLSDNVGENIFSLILSGITLFFGKMTWFIAIVSMLYGIILFFYEKIGINITQGKVVALTGLFLSWGMILIRGSVVHGKTLSGNFTEAGRQLLEIGFNRESGGILGALLSMPFFKVLHFQWMFFILLILALLFVAWLVRDLIELGYEVLKEIIKYYKSDDYKEKKRKLAAKKYAENLKRTDYKRYQKEMLKAKIIQSRNEKLSFEIAKKPKKNFLQKTEVYSKGELAEKEKEWIEIFEEKEKGNFIKDENARREKIKEKRKKEDTLDAVVKPLESVKKTEILEKSEDNGENTLNTEKEKITEDKKEIKKEKELEIENVNENNKKETKLEIVTPLKRAEINSVNADPNFQQFPKLEAFENGDGKEKGLEEELRKVNAMFDNNQGYDDVVKKSIAEIFKSKPMDVEKKKEIEENIRENVNHLENVLKEFGVDAKVVNYEYGPTITRYEIIIPKGVKVSKVTGLSDDIAMNLAAESIRIEAPIPGKNTIGIETPNKIKEPVHFSNIIKNKELDTGELKVILGKDIVGRDKFIDIVKMPHLLIAGQTGSGKSVCVNTLISTLISKKSDKEVKFIMVDPKMVELMPYNDIPHLLVPVIIDPQQAAIALKWAVNEMENRYKKLMENGVRNIKGYNSLSFVEKMPYIVIIIDELADLMMVASGSVEESIARIAQKARAVGIHLVVATQRPSTDVITGMIKANLPSRISFALRSQIDSRTILDSAGAEKLLGQGDMLLLANGSSKLERIQGAYISDEEVKNLTDTLKSTKKVKYKNEILKEPEEEIEDDTDPYFENAINIIRQENKVSISLLQRKLKVGFNRASRIYDQLKEHGIISYDDQIIVDNIDEND
ncbi:DNA translocase FtsK [Leptotrichia wadei]|uniref:Cell division protein FtsK n=1 Tax=Leptotrichia wadei TaxID=157687 RepID=A0A510JWY0_9FUSO|nr:DNA translocase FtsK [Leptotrichia wadei]BBM43654.1 cell division protein FtsK [Leptotrichia wadei]BBM50779.1 cell division protein FtsK [Leptotrichia wadei]